MKDVSDLRRKSKAGLALRKAMIREVLPRLRTLAAGHDLRLEQIRAELLRRQCVVSHRQIQRWAEDGQLPGAYRLKRGGGHWRVRVCPAFAWWYACLPTSLSMRRFASVARRVISRKDEKERSRVFEGYAAAMEVQHKSADDSTALANAFDRPLSDLSVSEWKKYGAKADQIEFVRLLRDLNDLGCKDNDLPGELRRALGVSDSTFKRRGYVKLLHQFTCDAPILDKDPRAPKMYKNQVLQETEQDDAD